ncbi:MAG: HPF/RaiA family ribosome-associated protein [Chlorobium sp.]|uniref:HPF/RaiA family ribosome-associated protein n=1 Tax=Chlorobium sp. TaxID=1095 RepID=UPI001DC11BA7|nr:HPF/RaiA family ribosome-associated protein [Chlorobium sp.]MBN1279904.1 HPF/RaiA family ribosome-associated protein [Chlorobiaceae bacterium]MCF8217142.1 HPF/RaiA family ribosome-associated protein [Chlorobium sp.]MCF8271989.1 HPF/RaiA family ribosome-associated protein [Chlorobium sp.]MCF8288360.1 HPF/RaiA family ribosome-associated protein [Chlorobium sp.]MCF8291951.1 HPF/RaiA family ribosome-associated protein [Chlorobium sp.]
MIIQVNTDNNIEGHQALSEQLKVEVQNSLERFGDKITRVEVHLSDDNSNKKSGPDDKRCLLEARLAGLQPLAVSHQAATTEQAVDGAVDKLMRSIDATLGKLENQK